MTPADDYFYRVNKNYKTHNKKWENQLFFVEDEDSRIWQR